MTTAKTTKQEALPTDEQEVRPTAESVIWTTLSKINVSEHTKKKGDRLTYLPWTLAWQLLMDNFPASYYTFEDSTFPDGTMEVSCSISVSVYPEEQNVVRTMWLPIMNHKNQAVQNPDARQVSDSRMRALAKCVAILGLGLHVYSGEEFTLYEKTEAAKPITVSQILEVKNLIEESGVDITTMLNHFKIEAISELDPKAYESAVTLLKNRIARNKLAEEQGEES